MATVEKVLPTQHGIRESLANSAAKGLNSMGALAIIIGLITALFLFNAGNIDSLSSEVNERIDAVNKRIDAVNERIDTVNQRIDNFTTEMNQRFEVIDKRLDNIEKAILTLTHEIKSRY